MRNIIVIAYQLHYSNGSEYAVAWDYITHMSKSNRLTVLYGTCRGHHNIGNTDEMQEYFESHPLCNVTLIPVKPSFKQHNYGFSLFGILRFYGEYRKWHKDVLRVVKNLIKTNHYDLIHFLGPIGYHEPGFLYELPIPYIWGPIGGLGSIPPFRLVFSQGIDSKTIVFYAKCLISRLSLYLNKRAHIAMSKSDVLICATTEYQKTAEKLLKLKNHSVIQYLPENCIGKLYQLDKQKFSSNIINLIYVGRLDIGKAPFLILDALRLIGNDSRIHLDMLGDGPRLKIAQKFVEREGLSQMVTFHGRLDRSSVFNLFSKAHLMVLPSLYDANTTVVWEAMSYCVPTLCLDHCGMHDTIKEHSGIKIKISDYKNTVNSIANHLKQLADRPVLLKIMAEQLEKDRLKYTWEKRSAIFEDYYTLAEKNFILRK